MNPICTQLVGQYLHKQINAAKEMTDSDSAYSNLGRLLGRIDGAASLLHFIWPELDRKTQVNIVQALESGTKIKGGQFAPIREVCQAHHRKLSMLIF